MLNVDLEEDTGIALLTPAGQLTEQDFVAAATIVDPFIERSGGLKGLIIHVQSFPGWDSFAALVAHLKFVREHHEQISCVAFATDSPVGSFAEHVAKHFVNAEIKHFGFDELDAAKTWVLTGSEH